MNFNIQTDSRKIKKGDIFVALKTIEGDGHDYIESAIKNGASKIIAMHGNYDIETEIVKDTRIYLEKYLIDNYKKYIDKLNIIAITGTNGKTTTAHLMYQALNKLGKKCVNIGGLGYYSSKGKEFNLDNTVPDLCDTYSLLMKAYNDGYEYVSMEASSHGLFGRRLVGIEYDYAIFSNLTRDHLDYHGTMEDYALAKQLLFKRVKKDGKALICTDDSYKDYFLLEENTNITFGFEYCDYQVISFKMNIDGSNFEVKNNKNIYSFVTSLVGEYNILNLMPVIIILQDMGYSIEEIKEVVSSVILPDGRLERINHGTNNIYIDYAHTPDGLEKVVGTVAKITKGDTYVVFCCRGSRDVGRRAGMMQAATDLAKLAIVTNDNIYQEDPMNVIKDMLEGLENTNYEIIPDRKKAIYIGIDLLEENDSLLVLGHGHEETLTLEDGKKIPFVEKDIILDYLKKETSNLI